MPVLIIILGFLKGLPNLGSYPGLDEGIVLTDGLRMVHGQIPYRDFFSFWTPGSQSIAALLILLFGTSVLAPTILALALQIGRTLLAYYIVKDRNLFTRLAVVAYFLNTIPVYSNLNHKIFSQFLFILGLYLAKKDKAYWFGFAVGACALFTQTDGAVLFLASLLLFTPRTLPKVLGGILTTWLPFGIWLLFSGTAVEFWRQVVMFPVTGYQNTIRLSDYAVAYANALHSSAIGSQIIIPLVILLGLLLSIKNARSPYSKFVILAGILYAVSTYYLPPSPFFWGVMLLALAHFESKVMPVLAALTCLIFLGSTVKNISFHRPVQEEPQKYMSSMAPAYFLGSIPEMNYLTNNVPSGFLDIQVGGGYTLPWMKEREAASIDPERVVTDKDGYNSNDLDLSKYTLTELKKFPEYRGSHWEEVRVYDRITPSSTNSTTPNN